MSAKKGARQNRTPLIQLKVYGYLRLSSRTFCALS